MKGLAHITGSGIPGNLPRCLPDGTRAVLRERRGRGRRSSTSSRKRAASRRDEMFPTFNMGLGMIAVVASARRAAALGCSQRAACRPGRWAASRRGDGRAHGGRRADERAARRVGGARLRQRAPICRRCSTPRAARTSRPEIAVVVSNVAGGVGRSSARAGRACPRAVARAQGASPTRAAFEQALRGGAAARTASSWSASPASCAWWAGRSCARSPGACSTSTLPCCPRSPACTRTGRRSSTG